MKVDKFYGSIFYINEWGQLFYTIEVMDTPISMQPHHEGLHSLLFALYRLKILEFEVFDEKQLEVLCIHRLS